MTFYHPKYYKELRKRNTDQAISPTRATAPSRRATGPGLKQQAIDETVPHCDIEEAASPKHQAPSLLSNKPQASSPEQQASSFKPQASSSKIREPRKSFTVPGPRAWTIINVLCGCFTWKLIWWGENLILFPLHTFNSIVKKWPLSLQTSKSGVPCKLLFSSRISENFLNFLLIFS